jgi:DNA-directed RNA polymerase specialized sigma24 family protein
MADSVDETTGAAGRWELSGEALEGLLLALGPERNAAGRRYELLRRKLTDFFSWRRSETPEELADETLDRLARRLMQGEPIEKVEMYALGIARMLLKESARRIERRKTALREIRVQVPADTDVSGSIERCLAALPGPSRTLIERYYSGERTAQARELGISLNTLRNRALRIREKLYACITAARDVG